MSGLALGLAIVTHIGESTEALWERSGAVLLSGSSPVNYAEKVDAVLRAPELRAEVGNSAARLYEQNFHIRLVVDRLRGTANGARPVIDEALAEWDCREKA